MTTKNIMSMAELKELLNKAMNKSSNNASPIVADAAKPIEKPEIVSQNTTQVEEDSIDDFLSQKSIDKLVKESFKGVETTTPKANAPKNSNKIVRTKGAITLSDQQYDCVVKIIDWFHNSDEQLFQLAGYAGTGKSTVVDFVLSNIGLNTDEIHMCAPTGTASLVLKDKAPAYESSTLHRAIYTLEEQKDGSLVFVPNYEGLSNVKLLIVDEASMVGLSMGRDLMSVTRVAGVKVLVIGDPEQLPPVSDNGVRAFLDKPDFALTKIMRQAEDNQIINISMGIRNNQWHQTPKNEKLGKGEVLLINREKFETAKLYNAFAKCINNGGAVIVGKNNTRKSLTAKMRNILGFTSKELMNGERIVVKQNVDLLKAEYKFEGEIDMLTNGMTGIVSNLVDCGYYYKFTFTSDKFKLVVHNLTVRKDVLNEQISYNGTGKGSLKELIEQKEKATGVLEIKGVNANFGYILTCHASQGSQWDTVYVIDESSIFEDNSTKWLYTAVTRAAKNLVLIKSFNKYYSEAKLADKFVPKDSKSEI